MLSSYLFFVCLLCKPYSFIITLCNILNSYNYLQIISLLYNDSFYFLRKFFAMTQWVEVPINSFKNYNLINLNSCIKYKFK